MCIKAGSMASTDDHWHYAAERAGLLAGGQPSRRARPIVKPLAGIRHQRIMLPTRMQIVRYPPTLVS